MRPPKRKSWLGQTSNMTSSAWYSLCWGGGGGGGGSREGPYKLL